MELFDSTIDLRTYPEPYPFTSDLTIFQEIGDEINLIPYDKFIDSQDKDVIELNIQRYVERPMNIDTIDLPSLQLSYSI